MNIAIRSPNWIGDGVMILPSLRGLKKHIPESKIFVVTKKYLADIYKNIEEIDEILLIPDSWTLKTYFMHTKEIKKKNFEFGILFTNSFSSALFFRLSGIKRLIGYNREGRSFLLTTRVKTVHSNAHHQDYYMRLIENFIEKKIDHVESSKLNIAAVEKQQGDNLLENLGIKEPNPLIGMSPATAYGVAKAWHPERFKELIGRIKKSCPVAEILIFGSKREDSQIKAICKDLPVKIHNTAGKLTLRETIILISFCRLFITNDSGLMHIASSLGIPQVAIFGPTLPEKTAPLDPLTRIIHHPVDCAPCKYRQCPSDHRCMESVSVDEVMTALIEIWNQKL